MKENGWHYVGICRACWGTGVGPTPNQRSSGQQNCQGWPNKWLLSWIFTIWHVWPRPTTWTPATVVMNFTILVNPTLVINTIYLVCLILAMTCMTTPKHKNLCTRGHHHYIHCIKFFWIMPQSKEDFLRNTSILTFLTQNDLPPWGGVYEIYNTCIIFCVLTLQMLHTKFTRYQKSFGVITNSNWMIILWGGISVFSDIVLI